MKHGVKMHFYGSYITFSTKGCFCIENNIQTNQPRLEHLNLKKKKKNYIVWKTIMHSISHCFHFKIQRNKVRDKFTYMVNTSIVVFMSHT